MVNTLLVKVSKKSQADIEFTVEKVLMNPEVYITEFIVMLSMVATVAEPDTAAELKTAASTKVVEVSMAQAAGPVIAV